MEKIRDIEMHMENLANGKYSVSNGAAVANGSN